MAEPLTLKSEAEELQREYFLRNSQAEENRQKENQAATRIQSWFRACKVQAYLSHLHKKAVIIQKIWRGFTARARFRQMVKAAYFIMKMNLYEEMAVRIQRRWRGFFVRKYIHNFYARKRYLEGISRKNELVRRELDELEELQKQERDCLEMIKEQTAKVYQAHRLHHLLSTKQCPGVFNSPFRPVPHETELLLKQVKYQAPTRLASRGRACLLGIPDSTAQSFPGSLGSPWIKTARTCCSSRPVLPPIANKKEQCDNYLVVMDKVEVLAVEVVRPGHRSRGDRSKDRVPVPPSISPPSASLLFNSKQQLKGLFREPGEVWEQRVCCPDLTLRLQTSYTHLEEAQNQLRQHKETGAIFHHMSGSSSSQSQPAPRASDSR